MSRRVPPKCHPDRKSAGLGMCVTCRGRTEESKAQARVRYAARKDSEAYKEMRRRHRLHFKYRMTPEQYESLMAAQDGRCAICLRPFGGYKALVDHDHACCPGRYSCGRCVRGLLDDNCNRKVLPVLEADPSLQSERVREYLARRPLS